MAATPSSPFAEGLLSRRLSLVLKDLWCPHYHSHILAKKQELGVGGMAKGQVSAVPFLRVCLYLPPAMSVCNPQATPSCKDSRTEGPGGVRESVDHPPRIVKRQPQYCSAEGLRKSHIRLLNYFTGVLADISLDLSKVTVKALAGVAQWIDSGA